MTAITVQATHNRLSAPRGAVWAAEFVLAVWHFATAAAAHLSRRPRSRAQQAQALRKWACQLQATEPGFASDLYGAAARHEALDD